MKKNIKILLLLTLALGCFAFTAAAQTMSRYAWDPPVVSEAAKPNTMILLSNDWTGFTQGYVNDPFYENDEEYWGYFDPDKYYDYKTSQKYFFPVGAADNHYHPGGDYWSGNFLNWVTMSNVDFLRKALTGGRRSSDSVGNTLLERGLIESGKAWKKVHDNSELSNLVPAAYDTTDNEFYNTGIIMRVRDNGGGSISSDFVIEVQVCVDTMPEDNCVLYPAVDEYKPQGLLHKYAEKMRFALMTYSHAKVDAGGVLRKKMGDISTEYSQTNGQENSGLNDTMIRYINNYTQKGWDPLAEMFYDALRYFKGNTSATADYCTNNLQSDDGFPVYGCRSNKDWGDDPIIDWCQKNNIIILNDEYPSREHDQLPGTTFNAYTHTTAHSGTGADIRPYTPNVADLTQDVGEWEGLHVGGTTWPAANVGGGGSENNNCDIDNPKAVWNLAYVHGICPTEPTSWGTFYLAGLAYDAFTTDFRLDFEDTQNITTWALAYRASRNDYEPPVPPMNQMWMAAKYGNFDDLNGNGKPDDGEWADPKRLDENNNPLPKGYYSASDGKQLVDALDRIFNSILETTASSTSVSVLANSGQGEGNLVQAYYRPRLSQGDSSVSWIGFLQSLWVDEYGFIREDTGGDDTDRSLDHTVDRVIRYVESGNTTKARRYDVSDTEPYPDLVDGSYTEVELEEVAVLWDAGRNLAKTAPLDRNIFTYIDKDKDGKVADTSTEVFDDNGEVLRFYDRNYRALMPYLNVQDNIIDGYLGRSQKIRALNLVRWTQGYDQYVNPAKFIDISNVDTRGRSLNGTDVFKLGDIINSTPVTVAQPPDNYHIIYSDESYKEFYALQENRETVIYTGANDGMMHAFTSWRYNKTLSTFVDPDSSSGIGFGDELWAYIPGSLLPHLKWLPKEDYLHVYYVDMQPRIFDARIFFDSFGAVDNPAKHKNGWGTILVGGFGLGGGDIWVDDKFDDGSGTYTQEVRHFRPTYFAIDITDPRHPELLWERTFDDLGMSFVFPTIMRVDAVTAGDKGVWYLVFGSGPDDGGRTMATPQYDGESEDFGHVYVVDIRSGVPYTDTGSDWLFETTEDNAFMGPPVSFDRSLNYNTDAAYIPFTNDATAGARDWNGGIYKITVPINSNLYSANPVHATAAYKWKFSLMFDSPRPITAAPALSIDGSNNAWVYVGTGRLFDGDDTASGDFGSTEAEFLYGVKDPFYNSSLSTYYLSYSSSLTLTTADLFDADPYLVLDTGQVYEWNGAAYVPYKYFDLMVLDARAFDGWSKTLASEADANGDMRYMRNLNKPSVIGGLSLFSTFMPTGDTCSFGGSSSLYLLYYETGTAFKRAVTRGGAGVQVVEVDGDNTTEERQVKDHISLGSGTTSSVGIHIGRQNDRYSGDGEDPEGDMITGFVQQGTGKVVEIDIETAIKIRSGLRSWRER